LPLTDGPFQPTDESLKQYECPEWFRDAKLGIWSHWGPVAAPGGFGGNWYARQMYVPGSREYKHHLETRGHPSKFGYKDIIELWKAEKFDPDHLMDLYVKAGAKYFVSMGAHHDNFDLWNSKHQEWNAVNHGPKKDIVGLWRDAARKRGLRFGVSEHFARSYNWMQRSHGSDAEGPMAGVPYDGADPKYARLYGPPHGDVSGGYPTNAPPVWTREWFNRMHDLVHSYEPDLVYSDGGIPFGEVGRSFMADFYNANLARNSGRLEAVYTIKKGRDVGDYIEGAAIQDEENSVLAGIKDQPWQTDASIGTWFFVPDLEARWRRSGPDVIVMLADIVAKNGNLLLNIPQRGDGTIDAEAEQVLGRPGRVDEGERRGDLRHPPVEDPRRRPGPDDQGARHPPGGGLHLRRHPFYALEERRDPLRHRAGPTCGRPTVGPFACGRRGEDFGRGAARIPRQT
jgi:alpha-L-fucosidase